MSRDGAAVRKHKGLAVVIGLVRQEPIPPAVLKTDRLVLRPTRLADADRAFEIQSNWEVTRMLRMASFPPNREKIGRWFANHQGEWQRGEAYRFAVMRDEMMIGVTHIERIADRQGSLGYWLDRAVWRQGYASEAIPAVMRFAFENIHLLKLKAAHTDDDPASRRILGKLGFSLVDTVECYSRPRNEIVRQLHYVQTAY